MMKRTSIGTYDVYVFDGRVTIEKGEHSFVLDFAETQSLYKLLEQDRKEIAEPIEQHYCTQCPSLATAYCGLCGKHYCARHYEHRHNLNSDRCKKEA